MPGRGLARRCLFLMAVLAASARAAPGPADAVDLVFAVDLEGRFSQERCSGPPMEGGPGLAALAGAIELARRQAPASLVIGGSGMLGPGTMARYLLRNPAGSARAARLLVQADIEVFAPGVSEFAMAPGGLGHYLWELRRAGAPPLLSNLKCAAGSDEQAGCRRLADRLLLSRGGVRLGLLNVVGDDLRRRVGPAHLRGMEVVPPRRVAQAVKELRRQADLVVLVADLPQELGPGGALDLLHDLEAEQAHVDLLLMARLDHPGAAVSAVTLGSGTLIAGAPQEGGGVTVVSVRLAMDRRPLLKVRRLLGGLAAPAVARAVAAVQAELCRDWGRSVAPLPEARKGTPPLPRAEFAERVLDAMRQAARADVAVINPGAFDERGLPLYALSPAAIGGAIPYPAQVLLAERRGEELAETLAPYLKKDRRDRLLLRGLSLDSKDGGDKDDQGELKVNGRAIDPAGRYRIATIDFVAAGGDGLLPPEFFKGARPVRPDLRLAVLEYLQGHGAAARLPLLERPVWSASLDLGTDLQNVSVSNPADHPYDRPLLLRQSSLAYKLDGAARLQMDHPRHLLQLSFRGQYGQTRVDTRDGGGELHDTADLVNLLGMYSYRGFSPTLPLAPTPFSSLGLESEWRQPEGRGYRHLELSALFGARTALPWRISVSAGVGLRKELLARSYVAGEADLARTRFLFSCTVEMLKRPPWPRLSDRLLAEFALTYSFTDPDLLQVHELRSTGKLYVALGRPLYVTAGADLYVYAEQGRDPGTALDITAGLKVLLDARRQSF